MRKWVVLPSRVHNPKNTFDASWAIWFPLEIDLIDVVHRNGAKALSSLCHITRVALLGTGFSGYSRRDEWARNPLVCESGDERNDLCDGDNVMMLEAET